MKIETPTSWAHKAKLERDSTQIVQDLYSETGLIGDNLHITHQIVINHDQIQECLQTQIHNNPHKNLHKLSLHALDAYALTAHK